MNDNNVCVDETVLFPQFQFNHTVHNHELLSFLLKSTTSFTLCAPLKPKSPQDLVNPNISLSNKLSFSTVSPKHKDQNTWGLNTTIALAVLKLMAHLEDSDPNI